MQKITSFAELKAMLETAKNGGQFASVTIRSEWKLNQYPTDGSERVKRNFASPTKEVRYTFNFAEWYKKSKAKAEGVAIEDIHLDNSLGWRYDVERLLKHRESTPNRHNIVVMPKQGKVLGYYYGDEKLSDEQIAICKHYEAKENLKYIAPYVDKITELVIGKNTYSVAISE